jgi:hypothetical protein
MRGATTEVVRIYGYMSRATTELMHITGYLSKAKTVGKAHIYSYSTWSRATTTEVVRTYGYMSRATTAGRARIQLHGGQL